MEAYTTHLLNDTDLLIVIPFTPTVLGLANLYPVAQLHVEHGEGDDAGHEYNGEGQCSHRHQAHSEILAAVPGHLVAGGWRAAKGDGVVSGRKDESGYGCRALSVRTSDDMNMLWKRLGGQ